MGPFFFAMSPLRRACILLVGLLLCSLCFCGDQESFEDFEASFDGAQPTVAEGTPESIPQNTETDTEHHYYDEEEFVGFENQPAPPPPRPPIETVEPGHAHTTEPVAPPALPPPVAPENTTSKKFNWWDRDWTVEITYGGIIVLYALNLFYGRMRNTTIAQQWLEEVKEIYRSNFYMVGYKKELIVRESNSAFSLKTTGRVHCKGSFTEINLQKRHDLLMVVWNFLYPDVDTITVSVPLNEDEMSPFVLAFVANGQANAFARNREDVQAASKRNVPSLPDNMTCFTDCYEVATSVLNSDVAAIISEYSDLIEYIYVTDIDMEYEHRNLLQVKYRIPKDMKRMKKLIKFTFFLVDFLPSVRLSKNGAASVQKIRAELQKKALKEAHQKREEEMAAKKEEEKKEKIAKMTPQELEKYNERMKKKRMKKMMSKHSKKVVSMA